MDPSHQQRIGLEDPQVASKYLHTEKDQESSMAFHSPQKTKRPKAEINKLQKYILLYILSIVYCSIV